MAVSEKEQMSDLIERLKVHAQRFALSHPSAGFDCADAAGRLKEDAAKLLILRGSIRQLELQVAGIEAGTLEKCAKLLLDGGFGKRAAEAIRALAKPKPE